MFLEIKGYIVDTKNRYLNLKEICKDFPGWQMFSEWKMNEYGYLECYFGFMACFSGYYTNKFSEFNLYNRANKNSSVIELFSSQPVNVTDPLSASLYFLMTGMKK